jgi:AraC-like DNA-binding protein
MCRIDKSIDLLADKEKTIAKIALDCGFNDQSHFTRSFREVMTTTPAKWRKVVANNDSL